MSALTIAPTTANDVATVTAVELVPVPTPTEVGLVVVHLLQRTEDGEHRKGLLSTASDSESFAEALVAKHGWSPYTSWFTNRAGRREMRLVEAR